MVGKNGIGKTGSIHDDDGDDQDLDHNDDDGTQAEARRSAAKIGLMNRWHLMDI